MQMKIFQTHTTFNVPYIMQYSLGNSLLIYDIANTFLLKFMYLCILSSTWYLAPLYLAGVMQR